MSTKLVFPTRILQQSLAGRPGFAELNADLRDACEMIADGDEAGQTWSDENRYFGYTSYASLNDLPIRAPAFGALADDLYPIAESFVREAGYDVEALELNSFWINVLEPGGHHSGHVHPNSVVSGTYYVEVPNGSGAIMFEDPRLTQMMHAPQLVSDLREDQKRFIYVEPQEGMVLMWESWLRHEVRPNLAETPRVSISFNYSAA